MSVIPSVPAAFFGMILGIVGLGSCWREASLIWAMPKVVGEAIMLLGAAVWLALMLLYGAKWIWRRQDAIDEIRHPVQCCFVGLVPVSTLMMSVAAFPYSPDAAIGLGLVGGAGQLIFAVFRTGQLWTGSRDPEATTPVLYLPSVAGNFVAAIVAGMLGFPDLAAGLFGAGLLTWFALESVIMHRLYVHAPLSPPLRPTMGIQLAPAFVGCSAYLSFNPGSPDLVVKGLFGYGLLQVFILARMLPWIMVQSFSPSYWAFTFGLTAMAFDAMKFVQRGVGGAAPLMAQVLFVIANIVVVAIAGGTAWLVMRGRILPAPIRTRT